MGFWRGAAEWLGLVNQDRYAEFDESDHELTEAVSDYDDEGEASVTDIDTRRPVNPPAPRVADLTRIITVHPRTYNEARTIGEHFRDSVPVIMNLTEMDDADAKRLVDFAAGLIFGLRGTIERVTGKVFLLSPQNVSVTAEDKERIAGGFYNQS
ncbi:cell division protein SepF [Enemella sp. A6]|uniref:cell division protein SepF n=1 Tax=Enemella sp. A6 TaxID=3440152 RepID=UPI003EB900A2